MSARILLVEDDRTLRTTLADVFSQEGYDVTTSPDGKEATTLVFSRHFDLLILDLMLPGRGGLDILRDVRAQGFRVPVLLLTVKGDEADRVLGLELGADDYVTKPFSLRELLARIRALLRRKDCFATVARSRTLVFQVGTSTIDLGRFEIRRDEAVLPLSSREVEMLSILHEASEKVVSRDDFLDAIWGDEALVGHRTIDTHVLNLRKKLESDPGSPVHLVTVHGAGYRLLLAKRERREDEEAPRHR